MKVWVFTEFCQRHRHKWSPKSKLASIFKSKIFRRQIMEGSMANNGSLSRCGFLNVWTVWMCCWKSHVWRVPSHELNTKLVFHVFICWSLAGHNRWALKRCGFTFLLCRFFVSRFHGEQRVHWIFFGLRSTQNLVEVLLQVQTPVYEMR